MTTAQLTQNEHARFTRYTQWLNGSIAAIAIPFGIWILLSPERRSDPNWLYWLSWSMATLHTVEEYIFPGGFTTWFNRYAMNSANPNAPLSPRRAFGVDAVMGLLIPPLVAVVGLRFLPLLFVLMSVLWFNAYFHLSETIKLGRYSPGVITATMVFIPGLSYMAYFYVSQGLISPLALAAAASLGLLGNVGFYVNVRRWMANEHS